MDGLGFYLGCWASYHQPKPNSKVLLVRETIRGLYRFLTRILYYVFNFISACFKNVFIFKKNIKLIFFIVFFNDFDIFLNKIFFKKSSMHHNSKHPFTYILIIVLNLDPSHKRIQNIIYGLIGLTRVNQKILF